MAPASTAGGHKAAARGGIGHLFRLRDFRLLWFGQTLSVFGDGLADLALLILINRLTGSVAAVAAMAVVMVVPQVLLGLFAGVFVDRLDRKRLMVISDVLRGVLVLGYATVGSAEGIWLLYLLGFAQAAVGTFFLPARTALLPSLVPKESLMAANSVMQTSQMVSGLFGTAAAGILLSMSASVWPAFGIDAVTFFVSAGLIALLHVSGQPASVGTGKPSAVLQQLRAGLQTIFGNRILVGALATVGITMLGVGAVNVLLVPLVVNVFGASELWFGAMQGSQTVAMVLSGGLVATLFARVAPTRIIALGLVLLGLLIALVGAIGAVWQLVAILFLVGLCMTPLQVAIVTLTQTASDDATRGQASATMNTLFSVASLLAMSLAGLFGTLIGVQQVFVVAGGITVLAGALAGWIFRSEMERPGEPEKRS